MKPNGQFTVLVVEDDDAVRRFSLAALRSAGFRTIEAFDGQSGLNAYLKHRVEVDLILTDVVMPEMSGPDMVEEILSLYPAAEVLFMSGTATPACVPAFNGRRYPVLEKPFTAQRLTASVKECLANQLDYNQS